MRELVGDALCCPAFNTATDSRLLASTTIATCLPVLWYMLYRARSTPGTCAQTSP